MPFTPAHAAAAVPLFWLLGSRGVLSALVIGSMTPDFAYFLPLGVRRAQSHELAGLAWFVLPVGLATYLVFHLLVKAPVVALLPAPLRDRLTARGLASPVLPTASWPAVVSSLVLGAITHLIWDSFTHVGAPGVRTGLRICRSPARPICCGGPSSAASRDCSSLSSGSAWCGGSARSGLSAASALTRASRRHEPGAAHGHPVRGQPAV